MKELSDKLENPYSGYPRSEVTEVHLYVHNEELVYLRNICLKQGFIQAICNTLIDNLVKQLKENGITDYKQYSEFVDIFRRCTPVGIVSNNEDGDRPNDGGRTKRTRRKTARLSE